MAEFRYKFEKGEVVEVMQDEEGFRGSLFEAKVLTARPKNNKVSIQYVHLVEDEETEKPLREYVDISNIRPSPRPNQDVGYRYKLGDLVDCFYEDAWWEGVIKKVNGNGTKFDVYFNTSQEEIEFTAQDMRLHREWNSRDGSWNPPQRGVSQQPHHQLQFKQPQQQHVFKEWEEVEVARQEDEFAGSWFTAAIERKISNRKFEVVYRSLNEDGDDRLQLREEVDVRNVRPKPPGSEGCFSLGQEVDLHYKVGWWCSGGVIVKVLGDMYVLRSKQTAEEVECPGLVLRVHREWDSKSGFWSTPPLVVQGSPALVVVQEEKLQPPPNQLQFVEVAGEGSEYAGSWFTAVIVKRINERQFLVHYQSLNTDGDDRIPLEEEANVGRMRPLPPDGLSLMTRDYSEGQAVDVRYKDGWWCSGGVVLEIFSDLRIDVQFGLTGEVVQCYHSQLRVHRVWDSRNGSWIPPLSVAVEEKVEQQPPPNQLQFKQKHLYSCSKVGDEVEVAGEGEYQGCWFTAVIAKRINERQFLVHYQNLDTEGDDQSLNTEVGDIDVGIKADVKNIRPLPPDSEEVEAFSLGQEVDVQYTDGWWLTGGVITKVLSDSRYTVKAGQSGEVSELEYDHYDLRIHREWDSKNGSWNPPLLVAEEEEELEPAPDQITKISYSCTKVGDQVEVAGKGDEHFGSWFSATIVRIVNKRRFIVEYQSLNMEDDCTKPLREEVDIRKIRPISPDCPVDYMLDYEVDAEYKDGWWCAGVISKVLSDSRFMVRFRRTGEEVEFDESQLRIHLDWHTVDGGWLAKKHLDIIPEETPYN